MSEEMKALERIKTDLEYITRLDYVEPIVRGEVRDQLYKIYHRELPELDLIENAIKELEVKREAIRDILTGNEEKKFKALNEIIVLYDKWLGNKISDFEFFTLLNEITNKYDLLKEVLS